MKLKLSYRKAIVLKPDFAEAHYNLGNLLQELRRFEEAEASYRKAISFKQNFALAHNNLGNTLEELGRFKEAEECYRQATILLQPDDFKAHNNFRYSFERTWSIWRS